MRIHYSWVDVDIKNIDAAELYFAVDGGRNKPLWRNMKDMGDTQYFGEFINPYAGDHVVSATIVDSEGVYHLCDDYVFTAKGGNVDLEACTVGQKGMHGRIYPADYIDPKTTKVSVLTRGDYRLGQGEPFSFFRGWMEKTQGWREEGYNPYYGYDKGHWVTSLSAGHGWTGTYRTIVRLEKENGEKVICADVIHERNYDSDKKWNTRTPVCRINSHIKDKDNNYYFTMEYETYGRELISGQCFVNYNKVNLGASDWFRFTPIDDSDKLMMNVEPVRITREGKNVLLAGVKTKYLDTEKNSEHNNWIIRFCEPYVLDTNETEIGDAPDLPKPSLGMVPVNFYANKGTAEQGEEITYTVNATNNTQYSSYQLSFSMEIPEGMVFYKTTGDKKDWYCSTPRKGKNDGVGIECEHNFYGLSRESSTEINIILKATKEIVGDVSTEIIFPLAEEGSDLKETVTILKPQTDDQDGNCVNHGDDDMEDDCEKDDDSDEEESNKQEAKEAKKQAKLEAKRAKQEAREAKKLARLEARKAKQEAKEAEKKARLEAKEAKKKAKEAEKKARLEAKEAKKKAKEAEKKARLEAKEAKKKAKEAKKKCRKNKNCKNDDDDDDDDDD